MKRINNKEKTIEDYIKYFKDDNWTLFLNIPEEELKIMSRNEIKELLEIPYNILEELSNNEDENIRWKVALNESTCPIILDKLSTDKEFQVRLNVARNKKTYLRTLSTMLNNDDEVLDIRERIARRVSRELKELRYCENKEKKYIIYQLSEIIYKLSTDKDIEIRAMVAELNFNYISIGDLFKNKFWKIRAKMKGLENNDAGFLYKLSKDKSVKVRKTLALNESIEPRLIRILHKDKESEVRLSCSYNKNLYSLDCFEPLSPEEILMNSLIFMFTFLCAYMIVFFIL